MDVRVLGPLQLVDGARTADLRGLRQRAVLAVLIIEAGRVVSSDALADLVWDGEPPEQAQTSLQAYISKLRRAVEPDADGKARPWQHLLTRAPGYLFDIDRDDIDAVRFERAADEGAERLRAGDPATAVVLLDDALGLWRGEPYADFAFSGFARGEIARLTELRWRIVEDRAEAWLALGRHRESVAELDALTRSAPLRERLRGQHALALYRSGRQADALASLRSAREALLDELGLDPGPELRRLERDILEQASELDHVRPDPVGIDHAGVEQARPTTDGGGAAPSRAATSPSTVRPGLPGGGAAPARPPMVGRDAELARTLAVVGAATQGAGGLVVVAGEAGIGKTRLAEETAAHAAGMGVEVVWGRCPELEGAPPFWPWTQVLRTLLAAHGDLVPSPLLQALVPELAASPASAPEAGGEGSLFQVYDAVAGLLGAVGRQRPLLVVIEDLHWADAATLRLLRFMATVASAGSFSVLATSRDEEGGATLADLRAEAARSDRIDLVDVPRLDREAVRLLMINLVGDTAARAAVDGVLARSGGNPFYIGELMRSGEAGLAAVPTGVRDVIARRVGKLSEPVQHLLAVASCCPDDFGLDTMAAAVDRSPNDLVDDVDAALAARVLHEVPDRVGRFRFAHPLVRDGVHDRLSSARRAQMHLVLADALEPASPEQASDELVAELVHHLGHAAVLGTASRAVDWSVEAGRRDLGRWAAEDAERRFSFALELAEAHGGVTEATLVDVLTGLGRARRFQGLGSSRDVLKAAIARARAIEDPQRIVRAALSTAEGAWGLGTTFGVVDRDLVEALQWAVDHLDVEQAGNRALHVAARAYLACELVFADDPERAAAMSTAALADARAIGGTRVLSGALVAQYVTTWGPDTIAERAELLDELGAIVERTGYQRDRFLLLRWTSGIERGDFDELDRVLAEVDEVMADGPRPSLSTLLAWRRSLRATLDGDFVDAEKLIFEAHELGATLSPDEAVDATGGQLALLYWLWGRLSTLVPLLEIALDEQPYLLHAFGPVLALARIYAGEIDAGRALLHELELADRPTLPKTMARAGTVSAFATACYELHDPELARVGLRLLGPPELDDTAPTLVDHVGVFYLGSRGSYRGILHLVLDEVEPAIAALERGLAVDDRANAPIFALRDRLHLADALKRRDGPGDVERAATLVAEASAVARRLDLVHDLRQADVLTSDPTTADTPA